MKTLKTGTAELLTKAREVRHALAAMEQSLESSGAFETPHKPVAKDAFTLEVVAQLSEAAALLGIVHAAIRGLVHVSIAVRGSDPAAVRAALGAVQRATARVIDSCPCEKCAASRKKAAVNADA